MIFDDDQNDPLAVADAESGEETVSGSDPSPESDDDVGKMVEEAFGRDPDPDMDNPKPVDLQQDIIDAEKADQEA